MMEDMRALRRIAPMLISLLAPFGVTWVSACAPNPPRIPPVAPVVAEATPARTENVVLVTLDGVRWQDVFHGVERARAEAAGLDKSAMLSADELMPNLHRLGHRGIVMGAPGRGGQIRASGPNHVSLPGYAELLTGLSPAPCEDNACRPELESTLADEFLAMPGTDAMRVAVISSWEGIGVVAASHPSAMIVSTGRHGGVSRSRLAYDDAALGRLEAAEQAEPHPGARDFRPDRLTANIALSYMTKYEPRFLFLGLGEPDEYAHREDYPGYLGSLRNADMILGELLGLLDRMGEYGAHTTVLVTTDHGRSSEFHSHGTDPESARVWLFMAGGAVPAVGPSSAPGRRRLADVAPTIRALVGLRASEHADRGAPWTEALGPGSAR